MRLAIAHFLVVLTVLGVESHPQPQHSAQPFPQQQSSQYPIYIPPSQQQPPQNQGMPVIYPPFYAYFKQFMALFREFLISQQNTTVPTPEPNSTVTTTAPVATCDLGEYVCVPVSQCEHVSEIQSFTCTNPQHVCCDD